MSDDTARPPPGSNRSNPKRDELVLRLRADGHSFAVIGELLGISAPGARCLWLRAEARRLGVSRADYWRMAHG